MSDLAALLAELRKPMAKFIRKAVRDFVYADDQTLRPVARDVAAALVEQIDAIAAKKEALDALYDLAVAYDPYTLLAHGVDDVVLDRRLSSLRLRELRQPIVARGAALAVFLAAKDAKTRIAAARLLSAVPEIDATAALRTALTGESDSLARYHLLFALIARGVPVEVPTSKDPTLSVIARFLVALAGGPVDPNLLDETLKKTKESDAFPGGDDPNLAVAAGLVGRAWRNRDPGLVLEIVSHARIAGINTRVATFALVALWPTDTTPIEPRARLTDAERAWLLPAFDPLSEQGALPDQDAVQRFGLVRDPRTLFIRRLLGLTAGPADDLVDGVPAWLLARRVVDGRAPLSAWLDAMKARVPEAVMATVRDLITFAIPDPWPAVQLPYVSSATFEAYARYFALVRATYALVPAERLEALVDEPRANAHQATALASLVDRGVQIPEARDARITRLLRPLDEYDVEGLHTVVASLSEARRAVVLADLSSDYESDAIDKKGRLSGLWYYADLVSDAQLSALVKEFPAAIASDGLLTSDTDHSRAIAEGFRRGIEATFRKIGARATAPLQKTLASLKPKSPARPFLESALAAVGGAVGEAPAAVAAVKRPATKPTKPTKPTKAATAKSKKRS